MAPHRSRLRLPLIAAAIGGAVIVAASNAAPAAVEPFSFALIGDVPYGAADAALFPHLVADMNNDPDVEFVAHAGDIKAGSEQCSDANLQARFDLFQTFEDPFWYTPGDNEWTDCRNPDPTALPTERLNHLRTLFFPDANATTGSSPRAVTSQASTAGYEEYVENTRFSHACVTFGTLHVVGSRNGTTPWADETPEETAIRNAEVAERDAANVAWVDEIFDAADAAGSDAVFLLVHARLWNWVDPASPHLAVRNKLVERAEAFDGVVLYANGDEHAPVVETGYLGVATMTRWQTPGGASTPGDDQSITEWLKVDVDCSSDVVFSQSPVVAGTTPTTTTPTTTTTTTIPDGVGRRIDEPATATAKAVRQSVPER